MSCKSQNKVIKENLVKAELVNTKPKLVVGIIVDQMRYDYLTRFYNKYGEGGFKRLMNKGYNCKNNQLNYMPTHTAPGHASVYTGTTPKYHGIIANHWYDKELKEKVYCAGDNNVKSVGTNSSSGKMSPHRLKATTFADENRLFTQLRGKTIGISIKDRGAILPAGHTANAAYWFKGEDEGHWITSSFYMNTLPKWVANFNASNKAKSYLKEWNTLYNINTYTESGNDSNTYERGFKGKETPTLPYNLEALSKDNMGYSILKSTPYGNSLTADFAIEAIDGEQLGADNFTDVLTISFSSTDYIGHNFGVNSKEVEDTYIRLDLDIERLLKALDKKVGEGEYTVFLTADHGALDVFAYLQSLKIPAGYFESTTFKEKLDAFMMKQFKTDGLVENVSANQVFLNHKKIASLGLKLEDVQEAIVNEIISYKLIDKAYSATAMRNTSYTEGIEYLLQKGYNQKRSGDVLFALDPAVISYYGITGSSHGAGYKYDTHVPLIFFGKGIKQGSTFNKTLSVDIAPTISALLGIAFPNAAIGEPLDFVLD